MNDSAVTNKLSSLSLFLLALALVGLVALSGVHFQPGPWYEMLIKLAWTPPNWLFPPVWSLLYLLISIVGWLLLKTDDRKAQGLWLVQLALNGLWSWLFFGLHRTGWALLDILSMAICIAVLLYLHLGRRPIIAALLAPYLLWVLYAISLNAGIFWLN